MSIAVMNWVWAHSHTSGNERLVLLALADACSRDDGTGCWPAVGTIGRKANISVRTVQRVIGRLEAAGHLIVHRGQGRHGTTNSYTVVIHSPRHTDAPDNVTGVTPGDGGPLTPGDGGPPSPVTPNPPKNHQRTTTPAPEPAAADAPADPGPGGGGEETTAVFAALGEAWPLSDGQRERLAPHIARAVATGWKPGDLAAHIGANTADVRNPYAVLRSRLSDLPAPPPTTTATQRPPWCGHCDPGVRQLEDDHGRPARCPTCHPLNAPGP